jgi:hypothetical protein
MTEQIHQRRYFREQERRRVKESEEREGQTDDLFAGGGRNRESLCVFSHVGARLTGDACKVARKAKPARGNRPRPCDAPDPHWLVLAEIAGFRGFSGPGLSHAERSDFLNASKSGRRGDETGLQEMKPRRQFADASARFRAPLRPDVR